jgi:general secretion pathway protein L
MPTWLGIDIGNTSVKVAVMKSAYRKLTLSRLAPAEVTGSDGTALAVRTAVAAALEGQPQAPPGTASGTFVPAGTVAGTFVPDAIAVAVDGSRVAIHRLLLPSTAQKQLGDVLAFELESQVPFDLAGAVYDWRLLEGGGSDGQLSIVAAVAHTEDVRARIDVVQQALAQEPERVAVGAFALGALVPYVPALAEEESIAIVDLGAMMSEVLVLEKGEPVFARTISTGTGKLPDSAQRLARDLRVSFAAHQAAGGAAPTRVYLCGGGAFVTGAEGFLSGALEIPAALLPAPSLDQTLLGPEELRELPRYAKAAALALSLAGRGSGMNLRRGPLAYERGFGWVRERIPVLAGLAAVIAVSFVFSTWARLHAVHVERAALANALGVVTQEVLGTEVTTANEAQELLSKEAALTDEDPMPHADAFDVMVRLSQVIPIAMRHDVEELDFQKGHVTVHGIVDSVQDAQTIAASLSDDKCLNDVKIKNTAQAVGSDRQKYTMEFDLRCPQDVKTTGKKKAQASGAAGGSASSEGQGGK